MKKKSEKKTENINKNLKILLKNIYISEKNEKSKKHI